MRILLVVVVGILIFAGAYHWYEKRAQAKRDASYKASLRFYSEKFQPGASRKIIEDYLRSKGIGIQQQNGPDSFSAMSDLILIGHYPPPWYCSNYPVYVEFDFAARETGDQLTQLKSDDSDLLRKVRLEIRGEGCL